MLCHCYVNASDDLGAWVADHCGRQAVTLDWYARHMDPDSPAWIFDKEADEFNLDCWRPVEPEQLTDNQGFFLNPNSPLPVPGSHRVFVQRKDLPERYRKIADALHQLREAGEFKLANSASELLVNRS